MSPATMVAAILGAASVVLGGAKGVGFEPTNPEAYAPRVITELRSQNASLEAALYRAERERCENLGVHPVAPAGPRGRR